MSREIKNPGATKSSSQNDSSAFPSGRRSTRLCPLCALLGWGVHALWQMNDTQVTGTLKEQMMHRRICGVLAHVESGIIESHVAVSHPIPTEDFVGLYSSCQ